MAIYGTIPMYILDYSKGDDILLSGTEVYEALISEGAKQETDHA